MKDRTKEIQGVITNDGQNLYDLSFERPIMLVFLRHFGCTFCREALNDLSTRREELEKGGARLVFVHMGDEETAERYFLRYNLENVMHVADPDCHHYTSFGLIKGNINQLLGLRVWMRGFNAGIVQGHGLGKLMGDSFQMPGVFLIQNGKVKDKYIHKYSSDKPNYEKLAACCRIA